MSTRGPLLRRFELDLRAQRELAVLRTVAAALVAVAGSWLLVVATHWIHTLFGASALLAAVGYIFAAARHDRRRHQREAWHLSLFEQGLSLADGEQRHWVPWHDVHDVSVDEERLQLVVERVDAPPLRIEPCYADVDLPGLEAAVRDAWRTGGDGAPKAGTHRE